ncbi:hypothetical protein C2L65_36355 [Paraburkholderia terrae]|uniref:Uncharacterized protein n=1 Tax=Paraburkholderia terrae TaxID=311230 RepID=A0A2I8F022_9BURK|nr:hypothetical protein C2L65_36355 [Paraburkholderia terrae]
MLQVAHWVLTPPLIAAYQCTLDRLLVESITLLALNVLRDLSLQHRPNLHFSGPWANSNEQQSDEAGVLTTLSIRIESLDASRCRP